MASKRDRKTSGKKRPAVGRPIEKGEHLSPATQWKPGQSGNPAGRPRNAGASIIEYFTLLQGKTEAEVKALARDKSLAVEKRTAARYWQSLLDEKLPPEEARARLRMMLDYTNGRPRQHADVNVFGAVTLATGQLTPELLARLDQDEEDA